MRKNILQYLCCPQCKSELRFIANEETDTEIKEGKIICNDCKTSYPIENFIPNFLPKNLKKIEIKVKENFSYKWRLNPHLLPTYKKRFYDEIYPVKADFIKDKIILNACCGIGIIDFYCAQAEAKEVIGFDISDSVKIARDNSRLYDNTHFLKADLFNLPLKSSFDYVLCLAAIHHLKNPTEGFKILTKLIKNGGFISIWVYAYEGNSLIRLIVEPLRKYVGTKLPLRVDNSISVVLGTTLYIVLKLIYHPCKKFGLLKGISGMLPMREYLFYIDDWPLKQIIEMVFDQLLSPVTHYHKQDEIKQWVKENNLNLLSLTMLNNNSWRCFAQKCVG